MLDLIVLPLPTFDRFGIWAYCWETGTELGSGLFKKLSANGVLDRVGVELRGVTGGVVGGVEAWEKTREGETDGVVGAVSVW